MSDQDKLPFLSSDLGLGVLIILFGCALGLVINYGLLKRSVLDAECPKPIVQQERTCGQPADFQDALAKLQ